MDRNWNALNQGCLALGPLKGPMEPAKGEVLRAANGQASLRFPREDGRMLTLHSLVDPGAEAKAWEARAKGLAPGKRGLVLVLGFGLGHHLLGFCRGLAALGEAPRLWVLELNPDCFLHAMAEQDLGPVLKSPGFRAFLGAEIGDIEAALGRALQEEPADALWVFSHPASAQLRPKASQDLALRCHALAEIAKIGKEPGGAWDRLEALCPGLSPVRFDPVSLAGALSRRGGPFLKEELLLIGLGSMLGGR